MKFSKKELLFFLAGVCGLLALGQLNFDKWRNLPAESGLPDRPSVPEAFTQARPLRLHGLLFRTDRQRKTVCATDEKTGALVWESRGEGRFIVPGAAFPLDLSPAGELWVANVGKKRLEQLDPATGRFIASWQPAEPFGGCCNPVRFAALARGRFLTVEKGVRRVCIYLPSGELERVVTDSLSGSEDHYYLYHTEKAVYIYDAGTARQLEVPYE